MTTTAQVIEIGKALLPYLRENITHEDLGRAAHDAAAALFRAKFGDIGLGTNALAIACGNDPHADDEVCALCNGKGYVQVALNMTPQSLARPDAYTLNAVERVLQLAERMLEQDRASLRGPQITLEMVRDIPLDESAIDEVNNYFSGVQRGPR